MSPRAACRLETLGFDTVYDYVPGKSDWLARGLPTEGSNAKLRRVHQIARQDVLTVELSATVDHVTAQLLASQFPFALVVSNDRTVLGRLPRSRADGSAGTTAGEAMEPGPSTIRADTPAQKLSKRLQHQNLQFAIVTTPEGRLIGVVRRSDL